MSLALASYRAATATLGAFAGVWLDARVRSGKEDGARLGERFGRYSEPRPEGRLVWFHAASVGETNVALALIEAMAARDSGLSFLISTGTRTSAALAAKRALKRVSHVYAPLDRGDCVRRFLIHWRPDLGVFVESELWPNLILAAKQSGTPLALANARMSPKSLARWKSWGAAGAAVIGAFDWIAAADARTAQALGAIAGRTIDAPGNLKVAAPAPQPDARARDALAAEIGARPVWLAASTHAGEDEIALEAHALLRARHPDALLIIAPRHPERGAAIAALAENAPRRSQGQALGDRAIYIADTLGEMGVLYALSPAALIGGSLLPTLKGHNPVEPAKLDAAILSGPYVESFEDVFAALFAHGGAVRVQNAAEIAAAVTRLWDDADARQAQLSAARAFAAQGHAAFAQSVDALLGLAGGAHAGA